MKSRYPFTLPLALLIATATAADCPHRSRQFVLTEDHALVGHAFRQTPANSIIKCCAECVGPARCVSINYDRLRAECSLNDETSETYPKDLQPRDGFVHAGMRVTSTPEPTTTQLSTQSSPECTEDLSVPLGMASGLIPDGRISASSNYLNDARRKNNARINKAGWCANVRDANQWLQVDFVVNVTVTGVTCGAFTQGNIYINKYKIVYSYDQVIWNTVKTAGGGVAKFNGPANANNLVTSQLPTAAHTRFIRLQPTAWRTGICMRFELYGCR